MALRVLILFQSMLLILVALIPLGKPTDNRTEESKLALADKDVT